MKYTEQELMDLPMNILTNVDIRTGEEEALVQKIINKKRMEAPELLAPITFPSSMTDNMTIEKERELQAKIDARNEERRKQLEGREEPDPVVEPEPIVEPQEPVAQTIVKERFCAYCISKGGRHMKTCIGKQLQAMNQ